MGDLKKKFICLFFFILSQNVFATQTCIGLFKKNRIAETFNLKSELLKTINSIKIIRNFKDFDSEFFIDKETGKKVIIIFEKGNFLDSNQLRRFQDELELLTQDISVINDQTNRPFISTYLESRGEAVDLLFKKDPNVLKIISDKDAELVEIKKNEARFFKFVTYLVYLPAPALSVGLYFAGYDFAWPIAILGVYAAYKAQTNFVKALEFSEGSEKNGDINFDRRRELPDNFSQAIAQSMDLHLKEAKSFSDVIFIIPDDYKSEVLSSFFELRKLTLVSLEELIMAYEKLKN